MAVYQIELTNYCNSNCTWCNHNKMKRQHGFMDRDTFTRAISFLEKEQSPFGFVRLHHFGESLLHPDINEYLTYLKSKGIKWRLSTNGKLLSKTEIRKMLLSYDGELVISLENGANIVDVNSLIKEKVKQKSKLVILLQTFGFFDTSKLLKGPYKLIKSELHSWGETGASDYRYCSFLSKDWVCILWDGTIVSCCFDMEGECVLGNINDSSKRKTNHPWRACKTCEVVERSRKMYNG